MDTCMDGVFNKNASLCHTHAIGPGWGVLHLGQSDVAMAQPITTRGAVLLLVIEILATVVASLPAQNGETVDTRARL